MSEVQQINKVLGLRTVDEARDIPPDNASEMQDCIIEDGQFRTRDHFNKSSNVALGAAIKGLYDYKGRNGVYMPIIGYGGSLSELSETFRLVFTLTGRASCFLHSRTAINGTSVFDNKLWFASALLDDNIMMSETDVYQLDVISIDTNGTDTIEASMAVYPDTAMGMCITNLDGTLYLGTGIIGLLLSSATGASWAVAANMLGDSVNIIYSLIKHGAKYYAATGYNGFIMESTDGTTWTVSKSTGHVGAMKLIEFGGNLYCGTSQGTDALGGGYGIFKLSSGSWTQPYTGSLTQVFGMDVLGSYMYVGEHDESSKIGGIVRRTSDGTNYTTVLSPSQDFIYSMCVADGKIYVGCADGYIYYSTDGTTWISKLSPTNEDILSISFFNSKLYVTTINRIYELDA